MNVGEDSLAGAFAERPHKEGTAIIQVASLFNQLLQHFPRTEFASLVKKNDAERCAKGFGCWTQFVSMLFCQLAHADSLREICNGLGCCLGKLVHLGIANPMITAAQRMSITQALGPAVMRAADTLHSPLLSG